MKNYLILSALLAFVPVAAQTSLGDYRQAVTEYSWELKVAASKSDAASETMGQARTGYLPRLSLDGSFTATVHHYDGLERWNFSVLPQLVQTVYGGGAVRAAYKQAELGYDIALCDEQFTQLDVRYAAEYTYWNLSAMELYAASMRQYVNIIRSLKEVVDRRFAEGYIAKGDVLMIDARLSEAQYGLVSAERNYTVALHNFNILRGTDPDLAVELAQGIRDSLPQPRHIVVVSPGEVPWNDAEKARMQALNKRDVSIDYAFMVTVEKFMRHGCENVPDYMLSGSRGDFTGVGDIHFFYSADEVLYGALPDFEEACKRANVPYTVSARPKMVHCYCMLPIFREAKEDFGKIVEILKK